MFTDIKEGDIVIVHTWNSSIVTEHHYELSKVTKVNKKTFKIEKYPSMLFTICRGSVYGGSGWERVNVFKYDEETYKKKVSQAKEEEMRTKLLYKVNKISFHTLTTDQLERIVKIAEEDKQEY